MRSASPYDATLIVSSKNWNTSASDAVAPGMLAQLPWSPYCQKMNGSSSTANSSARSSPRIWVKVATARIRAFIVSRRASTRFWKSFSFCRQPGSVPTFSRNAM